MSITCQSRTIGRQRYLQKITNTNAILQLKGELESNRQL